MFSTKKAAWLLWLAAVYLSPSGAQTAEQPSNKRPDPANAKVTVPPVVYRSVFSAYRPIGEDKLIPWKAANDEVARIGGWRVYAQEAREPDPPKPVVPAADTPSAPPAAPKAPQGHVGNKNP